MSPLENHKHVPQAMKELIRIFSALSRACQCENSRTQALRRALELPHLLS
ncbi:hypothetical protein SCP_0207750 [Sparassis crispa]|uniref:Uncharacterized protein n=1 Tax=Sparassis crispa TaxID=139825 RepID=A0A401GBN9_9APHY|nr:hypothetical protein SCP_0207750 [Sparassis crispa]GBE79575.1 hypothetical protein SCP_0207750 [Sparassis crispa]